MLTSGGERRKLSVRGAAGPLREALTGLLADGSAIVETAEIVGITDPVGMGVPVEARSTRGMGEAIRALLDAGVRRFFVALGGSSTNDGGAGLLVGLGLKLFDAQGNELEGTPEQLARVARLDVSQLDARLADTEFIGMSDVDNPPPPCSGRKRVSGRNRLRQSMQRSPALQTSSKPRSGAARVTRPARARQVASGSRCTCSARSSNPAPKP
jgi:glycerate kinase